MNRRLVLAVEARSITAFHRYAGASPCPGDPVESYVEVVGGTTTRFVDCADLDQTGGCAEFAGAAARSVAAMTGRTARRLVTVAVVAFVLVMAWLTFGPAPDDEADAVGDRIQDVRHRVAPSSDWVPFDLDSEELSNILLFVPVAPLVALRWPRRWWAGLPLGVAASAAIELTQLTVLTHRSPAWADLGWNSLGTVIGFVPVVALVEVLERQERAEPEAD